MDVKTDVSVPTAPAVPAATPLPAAETAPEPPRAPKPAAGRQAPDQAEIRKILREALKVDAFPDRELRIEFENDLHEIVVKVLDKESGEIIRQIPMPESLSIAKSIRAQMSRMANEQSGFAVDREA
jgi:uncharacterized FlaG/YvyC family protein